MNRRAFLISAASTAAMAGAPAFAAASAAAQFSVERDGAGALSLAWSGMSGPVSVFAASDPAAPASLMRPLAERTRRRALSVALAIEPRPYFLIEDANGMSLRASERVLPLQGGRNFRDLGGYAAEDGRRVRWGKLYRSGAMHALTLDDYDYLRGIGIRTVCDFRATEERSQEPTRWPGDDAPETLFIDYPMSAIMSDLGALLSARTADDARRVFAAAYAQMPVTLETQYREMFARLLRRETPLAFHCTAGKDRTGMAAALILSALGVSRDTIVADYALSERYFTEAALGSGDSGVAAPHNPLAALPADVVRVLMGADPLVMESALAQIDAEHGGPVALIQARYGFDEAAIAALRDTYLE